MKKINTNVYMYQKYPTEDMYVTAVHEKRDYMTKIKKEELPDSYCDVFRTGFRNDIINAAGVVNMKYRWVKENHFMKDSVLYVSYTDTIVEANDCYKIKDKTVVSHFTNYVNMDYMIFGNDILKFLAYAYHFSDYDLTEIRSQFIEQCEWLKENEPEFAPKADDFGEWFDKKIKEYYDK